MSDNAEQLRTALQAMTGETRYLACGGLGVDIASPRWRGLALQLRDDPQLRFEMLLDIAGIDYLQYGDDEWKTLGATRSGFSRGVHRLHPEQEEAPGPRFAAIYQLLSISQNQRLTVRVFCEGDEEPMLDSVVDVWASANWYEREAFDLYGILFRGHPDLRRILTDYGFVGHPFRKDFPLVGNVEVRYDPVKKRVVYEPVTIAPRTLVPKVIRRDNRYDEALKDGKSGV
ncbi:MAG: NADH-quinone oxidoreductase subunit C [Steroidobacteraceae bacterium]